MGVRWSQVDEEHRVREGVPEGRDHPGVEPGQGFGLAFRVPAVAAFVRAFQVDEGEVAMLKEVDGGLDLALVIGVQKSGGPFHVEHGHARGAAQALDEGPRRISPRP